MLHAQAQCDAKLCTKTSTTQTKSGDNHVLHTTNNHSLSASAQLETATHTHIEMVSNQRTDGTVGPLHKQTNKHVRHGVTKALITAEL